METETKVVPKPPRSKAMRYILIILAVSYFWATRHELWLNQNQIIRYNKWTGAVSVVPVQIPVSNPR
jgi:hypothetical protein